MQETSWPVNDFLTGVKASSLPLDRRAAAHQAPFDGDVELRHIPHPPHVSARPVRLDGRDARRSVSMGQTTMLPGRHAMPTCIATPALKNAATVERGRPGGFDG